MLLPGSGIYFWRPESPPCLEFTEFLAKVYEHHRAEGKAFEVLFLISENRMFDAYQKEDMPWAAMICNSTKRSAMAKKFGVGTV